MTSNTKILVLGAAGRTGAAVALQLLEKGHSVRAFVRRIDSRSDRLEKAGAEIFHGALSDFGDLSRALHGVDKAYFVAPWTADQLHIAMSFAAAAAQSDVKVIVSVTQWLGQPQHKSLATRQSYLTDTVFGWIPNVDLVKVNTGWFAENYMTPEILATISQLGLFPFALGDGKTAPVSNEDIARVVVAALERPDLYAGKTLRPTGPELLAPSDLADIFAKVLGRNVKYQNIPERMFRKAMNSMGMSAHWQAQVRHYVEDYQGGGFEVGAPNDVVLEMTGEKAEDFETIVRRYVAATPITRNTLGDKLRAIAGFIKLLMTKPIDLEAFERDRDYPAVRNSKMSIDYGPWLESHQAQHAKPPVRLHKVA